MVTLNGKPYKAMADQLTAISKLRLSHKAGRLSQGDMLEVERIIKLQLALS
jgi:mRNA interferase MazF